MAVMLVSHNNESVVMLARQTNCVQVELFSYVSIFCSN